MTGRRLLQSREYFEAGFPLYLMEVEQGTSHTHAHEFFEMVYVRRGYGTHVIGKEKYPIRAGDLFIIHPREAHHYQLEGENSLRIVNVLWQPALVRELLRASDALLPSSSLPYIEPLWKSRAKFTHRLHLSGSSAFRVEVLLDEMRREIEAAREGQAAPGCHALLRHLFCSLLILLSRALQQEITAPRHESTLASQRGAQQQTVARAIEFIEQRQSETIRVSDVASHVALSASRLAHLFKAHTGRSVIEYAHELRITRAAKLMRTSTLPAQNIAIECGFGDARFFHRIFRRHFGCSPLQWRHAEHEEMHARHA